MGCFHDCVKDHFTAHTNQPYDVRYGRDEEFVIHGDCHVAWLMKGRGYGANGVAQVDPPHQEEKLGYGEAEEKHNTGHHPLSFCT